MFNDFSQCVCSLNILLLLDESYYKASCFNVFRRNKLFNPPRYLLPLCEGYLRTNSGEARENALERNPDARKREEGPGRVLSGSHTDSTTWARTFPKGQKEGNEEMPLPAGQGPSLYTPWTG